MRSETAADAQLLPQSLRFYIALPAQIHRARCSMKLGLPVVCRG